MEYRFTDSKKQESKTTDNKVVLETLFKNFVSNYSHYSKATFDEDRHGSDIWVYKYDGTRLAVDVKSMKQRYNDIPTLPLETWSVLPENGKKGIIGWTRDPSKITDIILWYWPDNGNYVLLPFKNLREWFSANWENLLKTHRSSQQSSISQKGTKWRSECVFVEADELISSDELNLMKFNYQGNVNTDFMHI